MYENGTMSTRYGEQTPHVYMQAVGQPYRQT